MKYKFKEGASVISDSPYHDLMDGGYISVEELIDDETQLQILKAAIKTVDDFVDQAIESGAIELA